MNRLRLLCGLLSVATLAGCQSASAAAAHRPPPAARTSSPSTPSAPPSTPPTSTSHSTSPFPPAPSSSFSRRPSSYSVVALGDSVPSGYNCDCTTFVDLYAARLQQDTGVRTTVTNDAVAGAVSADVVHQLQSGPVAKAVAQADFVILNVGANDVAGDRTDYDEGRCGGPDGLACFRPQLPPLSDNLSRILSRIHALRGGRPVAIRVLDYWNVFEDGEVGRRNGGSYMRDSDRLTTMVDDRICAAADKGGAVCVRTYSAFKGAGDRDATPLLAGDGDHPNARGHEAIARLLTAAGYAPVA